MNFFKNLFNDESVIIGLCKFNMAKSKSLNSSIINETFSTPYMSEKVFETNFKGNYLLF